MGGTKNKSSGASPKSQDDGSQQAGVKKDKGGKGLPQKAKITVVLNEEHAMKALAGLKAITPQELARKTGVKISIANAFIRSLESKGTIRYVVGYSGHKVYALTQEMDQKDSTKREVKAKEEVASEEEPQKEAN